MPPQSRASLCVHEVSSKALLVEVPSPRIRPGRARIQTYVGGPTSTLWFQSQRNSKQMSLHNGCRAAAFKFCRNLGGWIFLRHAPELQYVFWRPRPPPVHSIPPSNIPMETWKFKEGSKPLRQSQPLRDFLLIGKKTLRNDRSGGKPRHFAIYEGSRKSFGFLFF